MADVSLELQTAIFQVLTNATALAALVGPRIYDRVPENAAFPYVTLGPDTINEDGADDCLPGNEVFTQVHGWSRAVGYPQVKAIAGEVVAALNDANLALNSYACVEIKHVTTRVFRDADGLTSHAVIEFRALTDG